MSWEGMRKRLAAIATVLVAIGLLVPPAAASPAPYGQNDAGGFLNVLPAGEAGVDNAADLLKFETTGAIPPHFDDQLPLHRDLAYADPALTNAQVGKYFKDDTFGVKDSDV